MKILCGVYLKVRVALTIRICNKPGMFRKFLLSVGALALLSACASTGTTPSSSSASKGAPIGKNAQIFSDYLIGSYSNYIADARNRSEFYGRAFEEDTSDMGLARRALTAAWMDSDVDKTLNLARTVTKAHPKEAFSRSVLGAKAFAAGDYRKASNILNYDTGDVTLQSAIDLMRAWSEHELGNTPESKDLLEDLSGWAYIKVLGQVQRAIMDGPNGDVENSLTVFDLADSAGVAKTEIALSRARLLSASGDSDGALKVLSELDEESGGFDSGPVKNYLDELKANQPISETLTPQQEVSWTMTEAASGFFIRNRAFDVAEVYLRHAIFIDPDNDKAKIWLAALVEEDRQDEALRLFRSIKDDSDYAVSARLSEANVFFDRDEDTTAMKILEKANRDFDNFTTREALGRARLIRENYKEALPIYEALVDSMSEEELKDNTLPLYFRAICYEREKQWEKAVVDFEKVLEIEPDDADALNYLGYTWVDRGENLSKAFGMIEKAVELEPESGAIVDSLGWAHYKLGRYTQARINLEKAVELTPDSATIIDHLGDVYWKLGRFREAGYQWKQALDYDPTDKERKDILAKLKGGLSAVSN